MKKIAKSIFILLIASLLSFKTYSQRIILENKDSLICFSIPQSRFLLKQNYKLDLCDTLSKIKDREILSLNKEISLQSLIIVNDSLRLKNKDKEISLHLSKIEDQHTMLKKTNRKVYLFKTLSLTLIVTNISFIVLYVAK